MNRNVLVWLLCAAVAVGNRLPHSLNVTAWTDAPNTCNGGLLDSYQLNPINVPTSQKNYLCSGLRNNCCTHTSQIHMFQHWNSPDGGRKLARFYKSSLYNYDQILKLFERVEAFAKGIADAVPQGSTSNCGQLAKAVQMLSVSGSRKTILTNFGKAYRFLFDARRGFYCALCDSDALSSILPRQGVVRVSKGFCSSLVSETMNAMSFKYEFFHKVARLYGQLLVSCNAAGDYNPRGKLRRKLMFFTQRKTVRDITDCKTNVKSSSAVAMCSRYCERFNPARLTRTFEGQALKIRRFRAWLQRRISGLDARANSANNKDDLNFRGRVLSEAPASTNSPPKDPPATGTDKPSDAPAGTDTKAAADTKAATGTPANEKSGGDAKNAPLPLAKPMPVDDIVKGITSFNEKYGTQLVVPISFSAKDVPRKRRRFFTILQSIFPLRDKPQFNVADFRVAVAPKGLNPIKYGYSALINPEGYKALQGVITTPDMPEASQDKKQDKEAPKKTIRRRK